MANFNFNKVIIGGRLTCDPELNTTPNGVSVTTFTIAVNRRFGSKNGDEHQADFFTVTAWRQTAEFITRYFRKASSICIVGQLGTRSWTDKNGTKRFVTEIVADEACFVDSKNSGQTNGVSREATYVPDAYTSTPNFEDNGQDEDLPF